MELFFITEKFGNLQGTRKGRGGVKGRAGRSENARETGEEPGVMLGGTEAPRT